MLSVKFSKAFATMEIMSEKLRQYADEMEVLVDQRTVDLSRSNEELLVVNQKISDSIRYAGIIQSSLLPDQTMIKSYMPDSFFIWKQRDIVGGDCFIMEPVIYSIYLF